MNKKFITNKYIKYLSELPNNKICAILCVNSEHRNIIYQYLDDKMPRLTKTGMLKNDFLCDMYFYIRCNKCLKTIKLSRTVNYTSTPTIIDETYSGICQKCNTNVTNWNYKYYNPEIIDEKKRNNMILIFNSPVIFKKKYKKINKIITDEHFEMLLDNKIVYEIDMPHEYCDNKKYIKDKTDKIIQYVNDFMFY